MKDEKKGPIQLYQRHVIAELADDEQFAAPRLSASYSVETVTAAIIVSSAVPVLMIYLFVEQKFSKGILLDGVKE